MTSSRGSVAVLSVCGKETFFMTPRGINDEMVAKVLRVIIDAVDNYDVDELGYLART